MGAAAAPGAGVTLAVLAVPAAVPPLPVPCGDLHLPARQAQQGAGGAGHVPGAGELLLLLLLLARSNVCELGTAASPRLLGGG